MTSCFSQAPAWMTRVINEERLAMNDRPLLDQLNEIAINYDNRISINRRMGELTLNFGGDNVQANNFEKLVPPFALKRRFADSVTIDLNGRGNDPPPPSVLTLSRLACSFVAPVD